MRAGQLRHSVIIQRATTTQGDYGEPIETWATIVETWARIEQLAGKERFAALQVQADVDHRITVRYQSAIDGLVPRDRVIWGSRIYDIKSVIQPEGRDILMQLFVRQHLDAPDVLPANTLQFADLSYAQFANGDYWETVD